VQWSVEAPTNSIKPELLMAPDAGPEQFHGEVDRISYRNDESGWTVMKVRHMETGELITVTGEFVSFQEGEHLQLVGTWTKHATFGKQFKAHRALPTRPTTKLGIVRYLSSGMIKGIGEKTAQRIVEHFGVDTFKILDENPGCLLQVPTLKKKKAKEIIESWKAQKAVADVMMFLMNYGISHNYAQKILKLYQDRAIEIISANPYQLAEDIRGIGFIKADQIAKQMGIRPDSPERIRAAILYQLQQMEEKGHCYLTSEQLCSSLSELLGVQADVLTQELPVQLEQLNRSGAVVSEALVDQNVIGHWRPELLSAEYSITAVLSQLMARPVTIDHQRIEDWLNRYTSASKLSLSRTQQHAIVMAATSPVFILTGGPGVGKTTTANAIIRLFRAMGKTVLLAAPTGRAAQRLSEVAAEKARTIHRLLEWQPQEGGFARNESNPLAADVIICDEASMLDARLAESLCCAVPSHAQLIFIGDIDQLPSVGPGNVLRDLIACDALPYVRLTEVFRQAQQSDIVKHAHAINRGEAPDIISGGTSDCQWIEAETNDEIIAVIETLVTKTLPDKFKINPVTDVQVLTPMNRGDVGTHALNEILHRSLNPKAKLDRPQSQEAPANQGFGDNVVNETEKTSKRQRFHVGDKVIQMSNNYDLQVFNGDIGFVTAVDSGGGQIFVSFADGRMVTYDDEHSFELRLAYAITIHKSQGSEFPVVILPSTMSHYVMLQRNLVYTALTRAKKLVLFVGSRKALHHAIKQNVAVSRQTNLMARLRSHLAGKTC
jgi:exodeoxyribonuclease V alpha subunit